MSTDEHIPTDEALLERMREGDEDAFSSLYSRWQRAIYRFALQMSGSPAIAEDVTQETFLALIRDSSGYRASRGSFGSYLYGIARHMLLRVIEREKSQALCGGDELDRIADTVSSGSNPHQEALRNQRVQRLWAAVLTLPVHYREVVVMCELHELDYAEAAESLGCSIGTVRSRLHRGRALLSERLRSSGLELATTAVVEGDRCAL